jgi:hypothetical protein
MKALFAGLLFALLIRGQDASRASTPGDDDPTFSLFRQPNVLIPPPRVIAAQAAAERLDAQSEGAQRLRDASRRRSQALQLESWFAALALCAIFGPAMRRLVRRALAQVTLAQGCDEWRELQRVDLRENWSGSNAGCRPSRDTGSMAVRFDRWLSSAAFRWLDKTPAMDRKPAQIKLDEFLAAAKFLDGVPDYLLPD